MIETPVRLTSLRAFVFVLAGIAFVFLICQCGSLILSFLVSDGSVKADSVVVPENFSEPLENFPDFDGKIQKRNIFFISAPVQVQAAVIGIKDKIKDLTLIGIVNTGAMEAIIKEKSSGKTIFVKTGQRFGDLEVKSIKENTVTLKYKDEETELHLV